MKVEMSKLRLAMTGIGQRICIGIPDASNASFKEKVDVTSDFLKCIIDWGAGYRRTINAGDTTYEVTVKKITPGDASPKT